MRIKMLTRDPLPMLGYRCTRYRCAVDLGARGPLAVCARESDKE